MNQQFEKINRLMQYYLLRDSMLKIQDGKLLRKGKLILFSVKDFHCFFTFRTNQKQQVYILPYPYNVIKTKEGIVFDYTYNTLTKNNKSIQNALSILNFQKTSKINDKRVIIKELE